MTPTTTLTCGEAATLSLSNTSAVTALGGPTPGAVICYTTDSSTPACNGTGTTICSGAIPAGTLIANGEVNWTTCLANFTPDPGTQTVSLAPFVQTGAIALDGALGDWSLALPPTAGEALATNGGREALFTYNGANLYFALDGIDAVGSATTRVAIYVGDGAASGGASSVPTSLTSVADGTGGALPVSASLQYLVEWAPSPGTAAPTVMVWNNSVPGWQASGVTAAFGFSVANGNVEFSVPVASLTQLTTGKYTVIESVVTGAGSTSAQPGDWTVTTQGAGANAHGFDDPTTSCLLPNQQTF